MDHTRTLLQAIEKAVKDATEGKDTAVAFSGGLDSGVVAAFASKYFRELRSYTVGTPDSHDVVSAKEMAKKMGIDNTVIKIEEDDIIQALEKMIMITGTRDPVTLSFEIPLFFVCRECSEKDIIGGQGADELFAGYSKYVGVGPEPLKAMISSDMEKLRNSTLPHEKAVADHFGKTIHYPFLNEDVVRVVEEMDISELMSDGSPLSRKRPLRDIADIMGLEALSTRDKKAAQYGSGAMTLIKRICRSKDITYKQLIDELSGGDTIDQ